MVFNAGSGEVIMAIGVLASATILSIVGNMIWRKFFGAYAPLRERTDGLGTDQRVVVSAVIGSVGTGWLVVLGSSLVIAVGLVCGIVGVAWVLTRLESDAETGVTV